MEYEEFKKLQINAATDALTGLYNRRLFDEYCDKELNRAKRYGQQLSGCGVGLVHHFVGVLRAHRHLGLGDARCAPTGWPRPSWTPVSTYSVIQGTVVSAEHVSKTV